MSKSINVTPETLEKIAKSVNDRTGEYAKAYKELYTHVRAMASNWKGEANRDYTNQIEGFEKEFENLKKVLDGYEAVLRHAAKVYADTEKNIRDSAKTLTTGR